MNTPVCDFVQAYKDRRGVRMHMPGHKGMVHLGPESLDLTEISGADELYRAHGIIRESEENTARLFGAARTVFGTEGSSQCVRAMVALALSFSRNQGGPARLLAGRNAHQSFISAVALLGAEVDWLFPSPSEASAEDLLSCPVSPKALDQALSFRRYAAVYLTSPDYLGHLADIASLAAVCHAHHTLLLVDNAHGAYLRFLPEDCHPLSLGADLCCDSAHKTLPCLTGAAYLHLSRSAPAFLADRLESAMKLFGSTSPSWLILQSLDLANGDLAGTFPSRLADAVCRLAGLKASLVSLGWILVGEESLKLTLEAKSFGYTGLALAERLRRHGIEPEFADPDFLTLMPSPDTPAAHWYRLSRALRSIPRRSPLLEMPPPLSHPPRACAIREALLGNQEVIPLSQAAGRILADASLSCPPAVYPAVPGERLTPEVIACFRYYGFTACSVLRE